MRTTIRVASGAVIVFAATFSAVGCSSSASDEGVASTSSEVRFKKPEACRMIDDGRRERQECYVSGNLTLDDALRMGMTAGTCTNVVITLGTAVAGATTIVLTPAAVLSAAAAAAELGYCLMGIKQSLQTLSRTVSCRSWNYYVDVPSAQCNLQCASHSSRTILGACYCATEPGACDEPTLTVSTPEPPAAGCTSTDTGGGCMTCSVDKTVDPAGRAACSGSDSAPPNKVLWDVNRGSRYRCTPTGWRRCQN